MKSHTIQDVNASLILNAISKIMDSVRSAKNKESSYMDEVRVCLGKCRDIATKKEEKLEGYLRIKADLERKIRTLEETIPTLEKEAREFYTIANRLDNRARELDDRRWLFTKIAMAVIGALFVTLTAGLILTVVAVAFLANFNLNTPSGCRDGAWECRQKAIEKIKEIESLKSNIREVNELQNSIVIVKSDIDALHGIDRELNDLMQEIESLNIKSCSDHVLGLLQKVQSRAVLLTNLEADSQLQKFKVEWNSMERQLNECSMPFSDFIF
ncbi:uncharacterized protein LOC127861981 [Dreissena polymorpha]|nr:uncharacterized protein LOC127861981 [Dreissena polymorpha]